MRYALTILLLIVLLLNVCDYSTTVLALDLHKGIVEENPVSKFLINQGKFFQVKMVYLNIMLISTAAMSYILEWKFSNLVPEWFRKGSVLIASFIAGLYSAAVVNNIYLILTHTL